MSHSMLVTVFSLLMLIGVVGVLIPILPSISLMFVIALVFGFIDHFIHLTGWELAILGLIAVISFLVDYSAGLIGAKYGGAGLIASLAGLAGMIIGLIIFPPFGGIIGLFIGVLLVEYYRHRDSSRAAKAATGSLIGTIAGIVINLILAISFLGLFIYFSLH